MSSELPHALTREGIERLIAALTSLLPAESVLSEPEDLQPFECDALTAYRRRPLIVALPESEAQVAGVLALCARAHVPVVHGAQ